MAWGSNGHSSGNTGGTVAAVPSPAVAGNTGAWSIRVNDAAYVPNSLREDIAVNRLTEEVLKDVLLLCYYKLKS